MTLCHAIYRGIFAVSACKANGHAGCEGLDTTVVAVGYGASLAVFYLGQVTCLVVLVAALAQALVVLACAFTQGDGSQAGLGVVAAGAGEALAAT
jgi:hypothetical protein